jgi:hypothetical protein
MKKGVLLRGKENREEKRRRKKRARRWWKEVGGFLRNII